MYGALHSLKSKQKLVVDKQSDTHCLSNDNDEEKWIEDYVHGETAIVIQPAENSEPPIQQQQKHNRNAEKLELTTRKSEKTFEEMLNAIRDSLSHLVSSDNEEGGKTQDNDEENTELATLSKDDKPCRVIGKISKMVQHCITSFQQKQMKFDVWQ